MNDFFDRIKRRWTAATILREPLGAGPAGEDRIGLVVYFDYEREFGNTAGKEPAQRGFDSIVRILREHAIRATWNCVGLVGMHYPRTIERLIADGHEIACHTYAHVTPSGMSRRGLYEDIAGAKSLFRERFGVELKGFHSPGDAWSRALLDILVGLGFEYDIAYEKPGPGRNLSMVSKWRCPCFNAGAPLLRIPSTGDDWSLFCGDRGQEEVTNDWHAVLTPDNRGRTLALGFHPWIAGTNGSHIDLFRDFIETASSLGHVRFLTGREVTEWARNNAQK